MDGIVRSRPSSRGRLRFGDAKMECNVCGILLTITYPTGES